MKEQELARPVSVVCYELQKGFLGGQVVYRLTVSVAGREGTLTRDWKVPAGGLTEGQYRDLSGYILAAIAEAIVPVDGVVQVLPV